MEPELSGAAELFPEAEPFGELFRRDFGPKPWPEHRQLRADHVGGNQGGSQGNGPLRQPGKHTACPPQGKAADFGKQLGAAGKQTGHRVLIAAPQSLGNAGGQLQQPVLQQEYAGLYLLEKGGKNPGQGGELGDGQGRKQQCQQPQTGNQSADRQPGGQQSGQPAPSAQKFRGRLRGQGQPGTQNKGQNQGQNQLQSQPQSDQSPGETQGAFE